ncbi:MAG: cell division FtsA domain-containing protein [bacterium]|nr:cell division FtsA domain-containing protein [bacterium]
MGFFSRIFRRKDKKQHAIALDIGTEYVKTLIFRVDDNSHGTVVGVGKERQRLSDMQGGAVTDIQGVIRNCEAAIDQAAQQAGIVPDQVVVGIAGELVKGVSNTITHNRKRPADRLMQEEIQDIVSGVQQQALEMNKKALAWETGHTEIDVQLVNSAVVSMTIDGYRVQNPLGFSGRNITVAVYNSFAPIVQLGAIQTVVEALGLDLLSVAAEPYAVSRCLGEEESADLSGIFIDIGGGTSDIAVVRGGGLEGTKMFALGGRTFTKRIANDLKLTFREAEEKKILYSQGKLKEREAERVARGLANDIDIWIAGVELSLDEFSHSERFTDNKVMPPRIFLCGGGSLLPEVKKALETAWWKGLPFSKQPDISFLKPSNVVNISDGIGKLTSTQDVTPMALATIALELVGSSNLSDRISHRVSKGLRT